MGTEVMDQPNEQGDGRKLHLRLNLEMRVIQRQKQYMKYNYFCSHMRLWELRTALLYNMIFDRIWRGFTKNDTNITINF